MSYEICEHGQMKRKCDICSLQADMKELEAERDRYRGALVKIYGEWEHLHNYVEYSIAVYKIAKESLKHDA